MTYKEFRDTQGKELCRLCRVTIQKADQSLDCLCLEWENSNAKWYALQPYEGRLEVGYTDEIWQQGDSNAKIVDVQLLTFYSPYKKPTA